MVLSFVRFTVLIVSVAACVFIINNASLLQWVTALVLITASWTALTVYAKGALKWSLINYILTPVLLWSSALCLLVFSPNGPEQYGIIAVAAFLSMIWMTTLRYHLNIQDKLFFRGNLLSYINSFIIFFSVSSLYAAITFISWNLWLALAIVLALTFILHFHTMLASHVTWQHIRVHSSVTALLIGELFAALIIWPTSFWVKGLLVTIGFYIITGLSRCSLTSTLSTTLIKRYLLWGSFIVFLILITAPWQ